MKQATEKNPPGKPAKDITDPSLRILKTGTCPSLSGKSKLTYQIGCDAESTIHFRVISNTGSGYFSNEKVSMDSIGKAIGESKSVTAFTLQSVYKGKSFNNGGFLLAVLKQEGLVSTSKENPRQYQPADPSKFMAEIQKLISSDGKTEGKPSSPAKKVTARKSPKAV